MAKPKSDQNDVRNIQIKTMVSTNEIKKHGGKEKLSKKFRELRDLTCAHSRKLTSSALDKSAGNENQSLTDCSGEGN